MSQKGELRNLQQKLEELKVISSVVTCNTAEDINVVPVGSKICGGPQLYLLHSPLLDSEFFLEKVAIYDNLVGNYSTKWGGFNSDDCLFVHKLSFYII